MFKDRIKELRRVPAHTLRPNPRNWRAHPPEQQAALKGILAEVGFADALLVRELKDGSLEIVDGHLRAETTPNEIVPVLVLDVTANEAAKILATHDAITGMALPDFGQLRPLLDECDFNSPALHAMFAELDKLKPPEFTLAATRPTGAERDPPLHAPLPPGASRPTGAERDPPLHAPLPPGATRPTGAERDPPLLAPLPPGASRLTRKGRGRNVTIRESYQIVITCDDEREQRGLYERLTEEGRTCRLLML